MSKVIFICKRNDSNTDDSLLIKGVCDRIKPDNLAANAPVVVNNRGISIGVFNPNDSVSLTKNSVCLGSLFSEGDGLWHEPKSGIPDGTFAIFRSNAKYVELISDNVASRTIWYVHTKDLFIASTSQRMIVSYLGSYKPNKKIYPWILSSGLLGPELSWDERIKALPGDAKLTLDRHTWTKNIEVCPIKFKISNVSYSDHFEALQTALKETFNRMKIDYSKWVLPLSGGFDSRAILIHLADKHKIKTVTWGLKSSIKEIGTDAYIAKQVSQYFGCPHDYYHTDLSNTESVELLLDRFLKIGEGRVDHIGGYLDGFKLWNSLHTNGISGIIRGDQGFGWLPSDTENYVRYQMGLTLLTDYDILKGKLKDLELEPNSLPKHLKRNNNETLELWRERMLHQYSIPTEQAALSDLKLSHIEIMNPLLSKRIISVVRTLPDELRTNRKLFKNIVISLSPDINFANRRSIASRIDFLNREDVIAVIRKGIARSNVLSDKLIRFFIKGMAKKTNMNFNLLAFRSLIITKANSIYEKDARTLNKRR